MEEVSGPKSLAFIKENKDLAKKLSINGTPAFYIMPTKGPATKGNFAVFASAVPAPYLQKAIDRTAGKKLTSAKKADAIDKN